MSIFTHLHNILLGSYVKGIIPWSIMYKKYGSRNFGRAPLAHFSVCPLQEMSVVAVAYAHLQATVARCCFFLLLLVLARDCCYTDLIILTAYIWYICGSFAGWSHACWFNLWRIDMAPMAIWTQVPCLDTHGFRSSPPGTDSRAVGLKSYETHGTQAPDGANNGG